MHSLELYVMSEGTIGSIGTTIDFLHDHFSRNDSFLISKVNLDATSNDLTAMSAKPWWLGECTSIPKVLLADKTLGHLPQKKLVVKCHKFCVFVSNQ